MPTTASSRRRSQRNRRGSNPPIPGQHGSKLAGRIMWLPYADELSSETGFPEESHNHPVLVLSKKLSADGKVDILMMTSFGGLDLETKHRYSKAQLRSTFLPIDPSPPHPDNNIQLKLNHGVKLRKNSYVKTEEQRRILFSLLRNYDRHGNKIYALTNTSYKVVVKHAGHQEPIETVAVPVTRQPIVQPAVQPLTQRLSVPSYGYGTMSTSQPQPVSQSAQDIEDFWKTYNRSQHKYNQLQRKPNSHSSSRSSDNLSKDAQIILGLIFVATFACGAAGVYWLFKNLFRVMGGLKQVDWHKVAFSVEHFLWDLLVNMVKVVKYLVITAAKGVALVAKGVVLVVKGVALVVKGVALVAKGAWGLARDLIWGQKREAFLGTFAL